MIQPDTLDAINYLFNQEIEYYEEKMLDANKSEELESFYRGYLAAMKYAAHTVNLKFIDSNKEGDQS